MHCGLELVHAIAQVASRTVLVVSWEVKQKVCFYGGVAVFLQCGGVFVVIFLGLCSCFGL